jgi:hypothetical protein
MPSVFRRSSVRYPRNPIITPEAYRTFVSFMFSAAMVAWGATLLGLTPFTSSGAAVLVFPTDEHLLGAVLYGCVLICFYWLYTQKLATSYLPNNMFLLLLDFVALSFMTGAATTWREKAAFVVLAICTLLLLSVRFGFAALSELFPPQRTSVAIREHADDAHSRCVSGSPRPHRMRAQVAGWHSPMPAYLLIAQSHPVRYAGMNEM